jgi:hypothetical protein
VVAQRTQALLQDEKQWRCICVNSELGEAEERQGAMPNGFMPLFDFSRPQKGELLQTRNKEFPALLVRARQQPTEARKQSQRCLRRNARLDRPPVVIWVNAADRLGGVAKLRLGNRAAPAGSGFAFSAVFRGLFLLKTYQYVYGKSLSTSTRAVLRDTDRRHINYVMRVAPACVTKPLKSCQGFVLPSP